MKPAYILFGFLFTCASSLAAGSILFARLRLRLSWPVAFVTGSAILSLAVTLLSLAGFAEKGVFLGLGIALIAAAFALRARQSLSGLQIPRWFWIGFAPFTAAYFFNAMAPEMSPDGSTYHLGVVNHYYAAHRMIPLPDNFYASLSQGVEMLFLFAWAFGRHSAASLVHFAFLVTVPLMIADYGSRRGYADGAAFAGLLFYAAPVAGMAGTNAYIDLAVTAVWFALFVTLEDFQPSRAVPVGVLAGFLYAAKYTAFLGIVYLIWKLRRHRREAAIACGIAALFVLPWVLRNALWYENPVAPMMNAWFPNPLITAAFEKEWTQGLRSYGVTGFADWALNAFVMGDKISGSLGPVWALAPLGIFGGPWMLAAAAFPLNIGTRFLLPALPFLALGIGRVIGKWPRTAMTLAAVHLLLCWPYFLRWYATGWTLERIPWRQALRIEPEESWLNFKSGEYRIARMIETFVPPGELVFSFSQIAEAYTSRDVIASYQSTRSLRMRDTLFAPLLNYYWPSWIHDVELERPAKRIRLIQTQPSTNDRWSISEISPRPARVRASDSDWSSWYAMDGNPYTRWQSGVRLRPGQWFEIEYDRDVAALRLTLTRDQFQTLMRVERQDAAILIDEKTETPAALRRWASETARQLGVRYVVIGGDDFGYDDFVRNQADWNWTLIAERGPTKLFKLN